MRPQSFLIHAIRPIAGCLLLLATVCSAEMRATADEQTAVAVTIYNQNLALVKDQRELSLLKGRQKLAFRGVSAQMRPETALFRGSENSNRFWNRTSTLIC